MPNTWNATFGRNAGSGAHRSNCTVRRSTAVIFFMLPVYGATPHGASPVSGYTSPVKAAWDAGADAGSDAGALVGPDDAGAALGVDPVHAASTIVVTATNAVRDHLGDRGILPTPPLVLRAAAKGPVTRSAGPHGG